MNLYPKSRCRPGEAILSFALAGLLPSTTRAQSAMPSGETLERLAKEAYAKFKEDNGGKNADYIPALAKVPSNLFGITIVTVDGKIINVGDVDYPFSMQSCSKVFTMCLVLQESGDKAIYEKVGVEPTGERFNSVVAIEEGDGRADNPFVNPGAIATVSLVKAKDGAERWDKIIEYYNRCAGEKLKVLEDIYKSEAETNYRNRGIAHILFNSSHVQSASRANSWR
jgi:glutaminase